MFVARSRRSACRAGIAAVWLALTLVLVVGMVAFAVDFGWIVLARNHLQVAADAASMAGVGVLANGDDVARAEAKRVGESNIAGAIGDSAVVADQDIVIGTWDSNTGAFTAGGSPPNAVQVTVRKKLNLFFGGIFGMHTADVAASAIAMKNPRDIAFILDMSGSMNNDSEIWSTSPINSSYPGYPTVGTDLMTAVFDDFGYGSYPGVNKYVGQVSGIPSNQYSPNSQYKSSVYSYLTNTYLMNNNSVSSKYRISSGDSSSTRKTKAYSWLIDYQLASIMPLAKPTPDSATNLAYWSSYLDYVLYPTTTIPSQDGRRFTSGANPYSDAWPNLNTSAITPFINQVGYQSYVQFMMDYGRDMVAGGNQNVVLSRDSPDCPWKQDTDASSPGYGFYFPPREQPTHAVRLAVMAGIQKVADLNVNLAENAKDHVCVIVFDTATGCDIRYPLTANSCNYQAAKSSVRDLQAVGDYAYSTASENGIVMARNHLDPKLNPSGARVNSSKILVFLSDGLPNIKKSSDSSIDSFIKGHIKGEWFASGSFKYERNAALMQYNQTQLLGWRSYAVGIGLGADRGLMDRMARIAGTAQKDPNNPNGPLISPYAAGNPADYQQRLIAIFNDILTTPNIRLVK